MSPISWTRKLNGIDQTRTCWFLYTCVCQSGIISWCVHWFLINQIKAIPSYLCMWIKVSVIDPTGRPIELCVGVAPWCKSTARDFTLWLSCHHHHRWWTISTYLVGYCIGRSLNLYSWLHWIVCLQHCAMRVLHTVWTASVMPCRVFLPRQHDPMLWFMRPIVLLLQPVNCFWTQYNVWLL